MNTEETNGLITHFDYRLLDLIYECLIDKGVTKEQANEWYSENSFISDKFARSIEEEAI